MNGPDGFSPKLCCFVTKQKTESQIWENKLMVPQGERWGGIGWKIGINIDNTAVYKLDNW